MWIADEVQAFSAQYRFGPEVVSALCGLCARLVARALDEASLGEAPIQPTMHATLHTTLHTMETQASEPLRQTLSDPAIPRTVLNGFLDGPPLLVSGAFSLSDVAPPQGEGARDEVPDLGARYKDLGVLGVGGMGEVRRVLDREIGRRLAMKLLKRDLMQRPRSVARFIEEAQIVGQLQHSGLVPVHEIGFLRDGRPYFTMREVRGREFGEVIQEVHAASGGGEWRVGASGWTFRKLLGAFLRVCEAVGYAHSKGVVHRDLKPANILIGADDEVFVVDWGIAKVLGRAEDTAEAAGEAVVTTRSQDPAFATQLGAIAGTPSYMAPEQVLGEAHSVDTRSDVYALGAILYEILAGRPPYEGGGDVAVLLAVSHGPPEPVEGASPRALPQALVALCEHAMSRDRSARPANAKHLSGALTDWLDNTKLRDRAAQIVEEALALEQAADHTRRRAEALRSEGAALLEAVSIFAPEAQKHPGWAKEDEAQSLTQQADLQGLEADLRLHAALTYAADFAQAHAQLARRYLAEHREAEAKQQPGAMMRAEVRLRAHVEALPAQWPERQGFAAYLRGIGALTLWTDPAGAEVRLYRCVERQRRLHEVFERVLGRTPLQEVALEPGSYVCVVQHPGFETVRYPVLIERQYHWDGIRPGAQEPSPIVLPKQGSLGQAEVYVPGGWFWAGGDAEAPGAIERRRLWVDGFMIARFPVTNAEYIVFLNDLIGRGEEERALRYVPRERTGSANEAGAMIYGRDAQGRFVLCADADGDVWESEGPVLMIDWYGAWAYCEWLAAKTGEAWQLPWEWCREKAARGVDGRFFPWGNVFDPSWCCMRDSRAGRALPAVVNSFPVDESPYGARGMAGNSRDWCADLHTKEGPRLSPEGLVRAPLDVRSSPKGGFCVVRGGSWFNSERFVRAAFRDNYGAGLRNSNVGFRVMRLFG